MNAVFAHSFDEPETYAANPPGDTEALAWLDTATNVAILARREGEAIGAMAGYILPKFEQARAELYIYDLAVLEAHRRHGAATVMIEEARRLARQAGAWTVFVQADTTAEDAPAQALYRRLASREITALHFDIEP